MSLKAGIIALVTFVWIIGAFLGSTFDYQSTELAAGQSYSTGTATFTNDDDIVTSGGGAVWVAAMEDGNIQATNDAPLWSKIEYVGAGYLTDRTGVATGSPVTLAVGAAEIIPVTRLGTFTIVLAPGNSGEATSIGGCLVTGSPVDLVGVLDNIGGVAPLAPVSFTVGINTIAVGGLGTFSIVLPEGNTGTATSVAPCIVDGSPVTLVAGNNIINTSGAIGNITIDVGGISVITTTGVVGNINIDTTGSTIQIFLYSPYSGTGGGGLDYTMRPTPGWAGTGGGGYSTSPIAQLERLLQMNQVEEQNVFVGTIVTLTSGEFWGAMWTLATWQFSFMEGYQMIFLIFFFPFVAMVVFSLLLLLYNAIFQRNI